MTWLLLAWFLRPISSFLFLFLFDSVWFGGNYTARQQQCVWVYVCMYVRMYVIFLCGILAGVEFPLWYCMPEWVSWRRWKEEEDEDYNKASGTCTR